MTIKEYIKELNRQYVTASATEHSYRPALKSLLEAILPGSITVVNEPKRSECGAPDYILQKRGLPVAFLEAKDFSLNINLAQPKDKNIKEQFDRYKRSLNSIIFTDYLDFLLYEDGEFVDSVKIAEVRGDKVVEIDGSEAKLISLIDKLANATPQKITSSSRLAKIMAGKARLLADVICKAISQDDDDESYLCGQMNAFREVLISDIKPASFADIYAQTITYGMFAARLHDLTPENFSRQEASELIPKTNPFLRQIFQSIAGYDLDDRIAWIVDDLAIVFSVTDVEKIMKDYKINTRQSDPMLHFYEDFLSAYDPALRKSRGVWYTPQPVVNYIVRSVDEILQKEFNLPMGLADTSKTRISVANQKKKKKDKSTYEIEAHKVQILDPATGTGTFLAEVVRVIYDKYKSQQGMWQSYVEEHLLPRLNGFEILMASYAMAHLKLDMLLQETGYVSKNNKRFRIYLTNSLEEHHPATGTIFVQALANEASQANHIKRDAPVMVVLGNPPYNLKSKNKSPWIMNLIDKYKENLNEKKINIDDDYIKFIRLGQYFVDKVDEGVLAYITNSSFIGGITHRQMRKSLIESFDGIYVINLNGSSKDVTTKEEMDENVFDIQQGVAISIFVKKNNSVKTSIKHSARVFYCDLKGTRKSKYAFLSNTSFIDTKFEELLLQKPYYFFMPKGGTITEDDNLYFNGFKINDLFIDGSNGVETKCDEIAIQYTKDKIEEVVKNFQTKKTEDLRSVYTKKESASWTYDNAQRSILESEFEYKQILFRPYDIRYTIIQKMSGGFIGRSRFKVMKNMVDDNIGLILPRQTTQDYRHVFVSKYITDSNITASAKLFGTGCLFPLYLYDFDSQTTTESIVRTPNLKPEIVAEIAVCIGLTFEAEKSGDRDKFAPIDLLDYIYGVLHTPAYRERYKEFLKVDFPRIPYPERAEQFFKIGAVGGELRRVHLMEELPPFSTTYPIGGENENVVDNITTKPSEIDGQIDVYINDAQYFKGVSIIAWNHYVGGYQPAQKWLKDRRGRKLNFSDLEHYHRIIAALVRTIELMGKL